MTQTSELERLRRENDTLRAFIANSSLDCIYCGLPASELAKCELGFPGCGRADDMLCGSISQNEISESDHA